MSGLIGKDIQKAVELLRKGGLVGIPTETVYGLAANALDEHAVARIFEAKNRPAFDPLILHLAHSDLIKDYVLDFPDWAKKLAQNFWPGPLTLVLPKRENIPDLTTSGLSSVALRVPRHPLTRTLLQQLEFPLAAPSANPFGYISPTTAQHVADQLCGRIDYILDGGAASVGLESTIVGMENGIPLILRKGGLELEEIEKVVGPVTVREHSSSRPNAPGMLEQHYAPKVPIKLGNIEALAVENWGKKLGVLAFRKPLKKIPAKHQRVLSPKGDLRESAANLFALLRELDALPIELIVAELLPEKGLGRAINDRLRRAAATHV